MNCVYCKKEYEAARKLPCCDRLLCHECTRRIKEKSRSGMYKCLLCKKADKHPKQSFLFNEIADELEQQLEKQRLTPQREDNAEMTILKEALCKLSNEIDEPEFIIYDHFNKLRNDVQLAKEETLMKEFGIDHDDKISEEDPLFQAIINSSEELMNQLTKSNEEIHENYSTECEVHAKAKEVVCIANNLINSQMYMNQEPVSPENIVLMTTKIEQERLNIKKKIFNNQLMHFDRADSFEQEKSLGCFYFENVDSSKNVNSLTQFKYILNILSVCYASIKLFSESDLFQLRHKNANGIESIN